MSQLQNRNENENFISNLVSQFIKKTTTNKQTNKPNSTLGTRIVETLKSLFYLLVWARKSLSWQESALSVAGTCSSGMFSSL